MNNHTLSKIMREASSWRFIEHEIEDLYYICPLCSSFFTKDSRKHAAHMRNEHADLERAIEIIMQRRREI